MHPQEQSWLISATQGNNEVSIWDVETGARQKVLWASPTPTLSLNQVMSVGQLMPLIYKYLIWNGLQSYCSVNLSLYFVMITVHLCTLEMCFVISFNTDLHSEYSVNVLILYYYAIHQFILLLVTDISILGIHRLTCCILLG